MNDRVKAIALCRVSTVKQSEENTSLEAQDERVREASEYLNADLVEIWSLATSSRKGKNFKRKELHEMLAYVKAKKKVKFVIVDEPDRFMRDFDAYYWWKVEFQRAGAKLVYAKKPELAFNDSPMALFEEMFDVFRAEASNLERITKTTANMQARVKLGYFPGVTKAGYQRTKTPGLLEPKHPEWDLLRETFLLILNGATIKDAVAQLGSKGYRTARGNKVDTYSFKKFMRDPYYAGIIKMSNWEINPNGLHKPMITIEQHKQLTSLADGVKYKPRKQFNPDFCLSNIMECTDCLTEQGKYPRMVGYNHNNGKAGDRRKYYKRYKCRTCGANILRSELHESLNEKLEQIRLSDQRKDEFLAALRAVWQQDTTIMIDRSKVLEKRLETLKAERSTAVRNTLSSRFSEDDMKEALDAIDKDIQGVEDELESVNQIEKDFVDFVDFSLGFIEDLRTRFWELDAEHLGWCKQLLFPDGFSVSRDKKVYTPKISEFYRLATNKKDSEEPDFSSMVEKNCCFSNFTSILLKNTKLRLLCSKT